MALHQPDCEICARIAQIGRGEHPAFLAELETGYAVLGDSQFFRGYTLFLCKQPAPDLEDLERPFRLQYLEEVALVSEAVANVVKPHKMNVESLGNVQPHLHFHLFPRQLMEREPLQPVWLTMPQGAQARQHLFDAERDAELLQEIRGEIWVLVQRLKDEG